MTTAAYYNAHVEDFKVLARISAAKTPEDARYHRIFPHDTVPDERRFGRLVSEGLVEAYDPTDYRPLAGQALRLTPKGEKALAGYRDYLRQLRGIGNRAQGNRRSNNGACRAKNGQFTRCSSNRTAGHTKRVTGSGPWSTYHATGSGDAVQSHIHRFPTRAAARTNALQLQRAVGGFVTVQHKGVETDSVGPNGASWLMRR